MGILRGDGDPAPFQREHSQPLHQHPARQRDANINGYGKAPVFHPKLPNIGFRHAFQPHRLPDAADGGIPHSAALHHLLSIGEGRVPQIVPTADGQHILLLQSMGDITGKGQIAPLVAAHLLPIDEHLRGLVRRPEVQQNPAPAEILRQGKAAAIPQSRPLREMLPQP